MIRGQTTLSPSGPKTKLDPTNAKSRIRLITPPSVWKICRPIDVLSTISAKITCSDSPHATVRRSIARRFVESAYARVMMTIRPTNG